MAEDFGSIPIDKPTQTPLASTEVKRKKRSHTKKSTSKKTPEPPKTPKAKEPKKHRKSGKVIYPLLFCFLITLFSFGAYTAAGFMGVPYFLGKKLQNYFAEQSELNINSPTIAFNPFTFVLSITDSTVSSKADQHGNSLLHIPQITAQLDPKELIHRRLAVEEITIDSPELALYKGMDGSHNWGDFFAQNGVSPLTNLKTNSPDFLFALHNISVKNGFFSFTDAPADKKHIGENVSIYYPNLSNFTQENEPLDPPSFTAVINGSPVSFTHNPDSDERDKVAIDIANMDLDLYLSYLPIVVPVEVEKGSGTGRLELYFSPDSNGEETLSLRVMVEAENLSLRHKERNAHAVVKHFSAQARYQFFSQDLTIDKLVITEPDLRINDATKIQGIASLLPHQLSKEQNKPFHITNFAITNGTVELQGAQEAEFSDIDFSITGYSNSQNAQPAQLLLRLNNKNDQSSVQWKGRIEKNLATGQLEWTNVPINKFFQHVTIPTNSRNTGRASLFGPLSVQRNLVNEEFEGQIGRGKISLKDVQLHTQSNAKWLESPLVELSNINLSQEVKSFGDLVINQGKLSLDGNNLPILLSRLRSKQYNLSSLDYSGTAHLSQKGRPTIDLTRLTIVADKLNQEQLNADNLQITAKMANGGSVSAKGRAKLAPLSLWLGTEFSQLRSHEIMPWFSSLSFYTETESILSGKGRLILPTLSFKGDIQTQNTTAKNNGKVLTKWQKASITDLDYKSRDKSLNIAEIAITQPQISWNRGPQEPSLTSKTRSFITNALHEYGANKNAPLQSLKIRKVSLDKGVVSIRDNRFASPWNGRINNFSGSIEAIDSTVQDIPFVFNYSGSFAKSQVRIQGNAEVFSHTPHSEFTLTLRNLPPATFAAQLPELKTHLPSYVDVKVFQKSSKDKVSAVTDITLKNSQPKSEQEALILALLKGSKEHATITVLSQNGSPDRDLSTFANIENQVNKIIVKSEISPFLLADKKYADLVDFDFVDFRFGEITLSGDGAKRLLRLRDFLNDYPGVSLRLKGEASPSVDRDAMQSQLQESEDKRVRALNEERMSVWNAENNPLDSDATGDDFLEENIFIPVQAATVDVDMNMLIDLANQRAEIIKDAFTTQLGIDKSRIIVEKTRVLSEYADNTVHFSLTAQP